MLTGSKSARMTPFDGDRRLISEIMLIVPSEDIESRKALPLEAISGLWALCDSPWGSLLAFRRRPAFASTILSRTPPAARRPSKWLVAGASAESLGSLPFNSMLLTSLSTAYRQSFSTGLAPADLVQSERRLKLEKVRKNPLAVLGHDGLGMELYALNRKCLVPESHNHSIRRGRRYLQAIRARVLVYYQRVIPGRFEPVRQPLKDRSGIMAYFRGLAMHQRWSSDDLASVSLGNCLIAQADSEYGHFAGKISYGLHNNAGVGRHSGPG